MADYLPFYKTTKNIKNISKVKLLFMEAVSKNLLRVKILLKTAVT